ncbi:MAG: S9 family peptidase [Pseudomonadota bacterium]
MSKKKAFGVEDLWQLERLGSPSLAPDGSQVVASLSSHSMEENKGSSALWLLSTLGGAARRLTACGDKDGAPLWSPDGQWIAFTSKREQEGHKDEAAQLYLIAPDGGEARRAAEVATGIEAFRWAGPHRLLFTSWVWPDLRGSKAQARQHKAFKARKETGYVTSEAQHSFWDHKLPMGRVAHLHLLELGPAVGSGKPGKSRDLFEGSGYELSRAAPDTSQFDVAPDGRHAVFAFDPAPEKRLDGRFALAEIEIKSGKVRVLVQDADWDFGSPAYSPDGKTIAAIASHQGRKHTMPAQLVVLDRASRQWQVASADWDHDVQAPLRWDEDGQAVLFTAEQRGRTHLWRFRLKERRAEVAVAGGWVGAFDLAAGTLITLADTALNPARLHVHRAGEKPRRIEHFNDALLARFEFGRVEETWIKGANANGGARSQGDEVQVWLTYPPRFDPKKKYPLLHSIHGGPHTGPGDNWHYRWNTQLFAAQGYVVASVNYHGSSGFGNAFLDSITHRWGALELQDIEAATDALLKKPFIDRRRVFATGGSYGGYMVAWMNAHVPAGRYQAYICHAGCFDWVSMYAGDAWAWHSKELGAQYWQDMAKTQSQSPHAFAGTMRTPTLVVHGALDYRVPDGQGLAYYNTLKAQGVDARLLWFPDENHWVLKPRNSRLWYQEYFAWLQKHDPGARGGSK